MENDEYIYAEITHLINEMKESKLDRMLDVLHSASDDSDQIEE